MSRLTERRARIARSVDRAWGESFLLTPRARPAGDPNGRPGPDPDRSPFTFTGRFTGMASEQHARSRATALETTRAFQTVAPSVTVDQTTLPGEIRKDDQLTRLDDNAAFLVERTADGGFGRLVLTLRTGPK